MTRAPKVIHQYGRPMKARTLNGDIIERQDKIYVPSYHAVYKCLEYDTHFLYRDPYHIGSTLLCTCGAAAIVVGYEGYKQFASYQGEKVLACMHYTHNGHHADGSL